MAKVKFSNGMTVNFDGDPTPEDIEEISSSFKVAEPTSKSKPNMMRDIARFAMNPLVSEESILKNPVSSAIASAVPVAQFFSGVPRSTPFTPGVLREEGAAEVSAQTTPLAIAGYASMAARPISRVASQARKATMGKQATNIMRDIIRPNAGEIKNIELRGKDLRTPFKIAAEEGIQIGQADGKLDTRGAIAQIAKRIDEQDATLTDVLKTSKSGKKYIDLKQVASEAKRAARQTNSNDTTYKQVAKDIDEYINDAIEARARYVSGADLNEIKRGMYSVGYNVNKPTSDKAARLIGKAARSRIEKLFPEADISGINKKLGDYVTLQKLLESAHGRVIRGGRLGSYFAQTLGAGVGAAAGAPIPYAGPLAGAMAGRVAGKKLYEVANLPSRLSKIAAKKARASLSSGKSNMLLEAIADGFATPRR